MKGNEKKQPDVNIVIVVIIIQQQEGCKGRKAIISIPCDVTHLRFINTFIQAKIHRINPSRVYFMSYKEREKCIRSI